MSFLYFLYRSFPNRDWRTGLLKALSFGGELFAYWRCRRTPPHAVLLYWVHYSVVKRQQCTTVVVVWCPTKSQWDVKCITLYDCSLRNQNYSWSSHVSSHLIKEPANKRLDAGAAQRFRIEGFRISLKPLLSTLSPLKTPQFTEFLL